MKIQVCLLFITTTIAALGQSFFGFSGDLGSSYRLLRSDYFLLNDIYHDIESPHIAGSFGAHYKYKFTENWAIQAGLDYSLLAFRTQMIENHPDEALFEISSQPRPAQSVAKQTHINRLSMPVLFVYNFRQSGNWRLLAATGVSAEVAGNTYIRYIFEDNQTQNITVDKTNRTVALLFQFGWINKLANRNQVSFSFRYMQDVVPAKNQEIHRYLNMLSFQVAYWFSV